MFVHQLNNNIIVSDLRTINRVVQHGSVLD